MKITDMIPKWLLFLVAGLGIFAVVAIALMFLLGGQPTPAGTDQTPDTTEPDPTGPTTPTTEVTKPNDSSVFEYAAITKEDTILFVDNQGDEIFTNLEHKNWQDIAWSPDGSLVSVLGVTGTEESGDPIYDLFVYDFTDQAWNQVTFFKDSGTGVTGYFWTTDLHLAFTQGPESETWLHDYDYPNAELLKVFNVDGVLVDYLDEVDQYVIQSQATLNLTNFNLGQVRDNNFTLYDSRGGLVKKFNGFAESETALRIDSIQPARNQEEFIFLVHDFVEEASYYYSWSFVSPEFKRLAKASSDVGNLKLFCREDNNLVHAAAKQEDTVWWGSFNPDTSTFAAKMQLQFAGSVSAQAYPRLEFECENEPNILYTVSQRTNGDLLQAFRYNGSEFEEVRFNNLLTEITAKRGE